jgi:hypothetical protein
VPISYGFFGFSRKRFTLAFGEPITIAATGRIDGSLAAASRHHRSHGKRMGRTEYLTIWKRRRAKRTGLERGRRRTRQDQISQAEGQLEPRAAEIANHLRDPHRTKKTCFFCRTGLYRERSSRLT